MKYDKRALRRLRRQRGWEVSGLAKKTRLSPRTVYYLDKGMTVPTADTLAKLATVLDVSIEDFFVQKDAA